MKRGTGGKEPGEHCWILFAIIGNGFQLLGKRHMAAVLGAQTQGETHRQNDTSLAGRPKDTNPYPGRDPYRGIHKGGGRRRRPPPFVEAARSAASSIWVSPWVRVRVFGTLGQRCVVLPMGFSLGLSTEHSAMCPLSYGCPPGYEPRTIEFPLGTIEFVSEYCVSLDQVMPKPWPDHGQAMGRTPGRGWAPVPSEFVETLTNCKKI